MENFKRILACVLAVFIVASCSVVSFAVETSPSDKFNLPSNIEAGGDATNGYSLTSTAPVNTFAAFKTPIDFKTQSIQFKINQTALYGNMLFFTDTNTELSSRSDTNAKLGFRMYPDNEDIIIACIVGASALGGTSGRISNFDLNVSHTFGFEKDQSGNWWLTVDGEKVTSPSKYNGNDNKGTVFNTAINTMVTSGVAYAQFGAWNKDSTTALKVNYSGIKIVEKYIFDLPADITDGGDATNGYTLTSTASVNTFAAFKTPINFNTQSIQFKINQTALYGNMLFFTDTNTKLSSRSDTNAKLGFRMYPAGTGIGVACTVGESGLAGTAATINDFDLNVSHTFGFEKDKNNKWWLTVDGKMVTSPSKYTGSDDKGTVFNTAIDTLVTSGVAFAQFGAWNKDSTTALKVNYSGIKVVEKVVLTPDAFNRPDNIQEGGNSTNGYTLNSTAPVSTFAAFKTPINFNTQSIQFKINQTASYGNMIFFTSTDSKLAKREDGILGFRIYPTGENNSHLTVACYANGNDLNKTSVTIPNFDWNSSHIFGFEKDDSSYFWLTVDGRRVTSPALYEKKDSDKSANAETKGKEFNHEIHKLVNLGAAFVQFGAWNQNNTTALKVNYSGIKVTEKIVISNTAFDLPADIEEGGNVTDGYTLKSAIPVISFAAFKTPINFNTQSIQFKINESALYGNMLFFTSTDGKLPKREDGTLGFRMYPTGENNRNLTIVCYANGNDLNKTSVTIPNFDWNSSHIFGFEKDDSSYFWLTIDGRQVTSPALYEKKDGDKSANAETKGKEFNHEIHKLVNSGKAFAQFGAWNESKNENPLEVNYSGIKVTEKIVISNTAFDLPIDIEEGGNATDGYALKSAIPVISFAAFKTPININTQSIQFKINESALYGNMLFFTSTDSRLTKRENANLGFRMYPTGENNSNLTIVCYANGNDLNKTSVTIPNFDWNSSHIFGFEKDSNGYWWLTTDGKRMTGSALYVVKENDTDSNAKTKGDELNAAIQALANGGKAYVQFGAWNYGKNETPLNVNYSGIKVANNSTLPKSVFDAPADIITGIDAENGYTLTSFNKINSVVSFKVPYNINTQRVRFKANMEVNKSLIIGLTNTSDRLKAFFDNEKQREYFETVAYRLVRTGKDNLAIFSFTRDKDVNIVVIPFDWEASHTFGFEKIEDEWWLVIDDNQVVNISQYDNPIVPARLDKFASSGKAYFQFSAYGMPLVMSNINMVSDKTVQIYSMSNKDDKVDLSFGKVSSENDKDTVSDTEIKDTNSDKKVTYTDTEKGISWVVILLICVGGVLLICAVTVLIVVLKRRNKKRL